jgi:hypothetical protein
MFPYQQHWLRCALAAALLFWTGASPAQAEATSAEMEALRDQVAELRAENGEIRQQLADAVRALQDVEARLLEQSREAAGSSPLDEALRDLQTEPRSPAGTTPDRSGPAVPRLIDVSLVINSAAGASTVRDDEIEGLQFGEHDPRRRGFTFQQAELSLLGAVDGYFSGEAHLLYFIDGEGESQFEVEEAFLTTQSLPYNLELEVGQFLTEFGRSNPLHPHAWMWQDQPVVNSRFFGPDAMRGTGARASWLTPLPWFSELHVGAQNAFGEGMYSFLASEEAFEEAPIGGREFVEQDPRSLDDLVYLVRWLNSWDPSETVAAALGFSGAFGPNATGHDATTRIYGADLVLKWRPPHQRRGWPFFIFEAEALRRDYEAADQPDAPGDTLHDWGFYAQGLWGLRPRWAVGLRTEYATASGSSVGGTDVDFLRDDRFRLSPLVAFYPSEFSRIRFQYNYDRADHLDSPDDAHSFWLGFEIGLGAHPAHRF